MEDVMAGADEFWWRKYLKPPRHSVRDALVCNTNISAVEIVDCLKRGATDFTTSKTETAACAAWELYAAEHPDMDEYQLLGLERPSEKTRGEVFAELVAKKRSQSVATANLVWKDLPQALYHLINLVVNVGTCSTATVRRDALINLASQAQMVVEWTERVGIIAKLDD